jgi:hypothetical protein
MKFLLILVVVAMAMAPATAQNYTGDFILGGAVYGTSDGIFRIDRTSLKLTTILTGISGASANYVWEVIMAENNTNFYAMSASRLSTMQIVKIDPKGTVLGTVFSDTGTTVKNAVNMYLDQNGKLVVLDTTGTTTLGLLYEIDPTTGVLTTVASLAKGDSYYGSGARDLDTGDHLVYVNDSVFRVDRVTGAVTTPFVGGTRIARMGFGQDTLTGLAYGGACCTDTLYEIDLVNNTYRTLVAAMNYHGNYGLKFERRVDAKTNALYNANGVFSTTTKNNGITLIDTTGKITTITHWAGGTGIPMPYSLEIEGSNEVQPVLILPPNGRRIYLSFPGHGGKSYVCAIGVSGIRPGIPLGDGRVINLLLDSIVIASVQGALDAFIPNRLGILDATGQATTGLDVNILGTAVQGLPVVFQVLVLDSAAPKGIAVVAEPYTIKLE